MRASTLFALTVAILIGLGVAVVAKVTGLFATRAQPVVTAPVINVLAANRNMFAGDLIDTSTVYVRPLKPEEYANYQAHREQFLPPMVTAAYLRIAAKNIEADQPILKEALKDLARPDALNTRLLPQMRAVNVSVTKDRSAGGLIQVGEWVDVYLTSTIENAQGAATTRTACVAPRVRIVAKRNTLWPVFASIPDDKPFQYTVEVNPYRAALLEYARTKGDVTLMLLPSSEQQKLETRRQQVLRKKDDQPVSFMDPGSQEADEEDGRVDAFLSGDAAVGNDDMVRIFGIQTPPPPLPPVPQKDPLAVEQYVGMARLEPARFNPSGVPMEADRRHPVSVAAPAKAAATRSPSFQFRNPDPKECKKCKNKKKAPGAAAPAP